MTEDRYITGYRAGRDASKAVCTAFADEIDRRPEAARIDGVNPSQAVRRLRQAASKIDGIPLPYSVGDPA